jgi:hypothetical protein
MALLFQGQQDKNAASGFVVAEKQVTYGPAIAVLGAILALALGVWGTLYYLRLQVTSATDEVRKQIDALEKTRDPVLEADIIAFEKKIKAISKVMLGHIHMSKIFSTVENATMPNVFYNNFSATLQTVGTSPSADNPTSETLTIQMSGNVPDFIGLARQMVAYGQDKELVKGEINNFSLGSGDNKGINFTSMLSVKKDKVLYTAESK